MASGLNVLDTTIQKTNEFLEKVELDLGWTGHRHEAYQATRAVLHAIRDRLPVDLAAHMAASLPLFLKGVYFEGWSPAKVPVRMNQKNFVQHVRSNFAFSEGAIGLEEVIRVVGGRIFELIGTDETENILQALSPGVAALFC